MNKLLINAENAEYQIIQSLKLNRSKRNKTHEIFIEGTECIKQALNANLEITRIITVNIENISDWAKNIIKSHREVKIIEISSELYNNLCDRMNPSELLMTAKTMDLTLEKLCLSKNPFVLAFDRPSDFGNLGSIIRSANAFGVDALFIIGHGIDVYEPKVIRASLGSVFHTKIVYIESMQVLETFINEHKILVVGTDSSGAVSIKDEKFKKPIMVIIGNEAKGMSIALKNLCDKIVRIPISGNVNSLNVASAASIIMWEIYKDTD
jgi:TrmH family RNA methyltransferase